VPCATAGAAGDPGAIGGVEAGAVDVAEAEGAGAGAGCPEGVAVGGAEAGCAEDAGAVCVCANETPSSLARQSATAASHRQHTRKNTDRFKGTLLPRRLDTTTRPQLPWCPVAADARAGTLAKCPYARPRTQNDRVHPADSAEHTWNLRQVGYELREHQGREMMDPKRAPLGTRTQSITGIKAGV